MQTKTPSTGSGLPARRSYRTHAQMLIAVLSSPGSPWHLMRTVNMSYRAARTYLDDLISAGYLTSAYTLTQHGEVLLAELERQRIGKKG